MGGVVPLEVGGGAVPEVDGPPVRVVTGVEGAAVGVELVRENELVEFVVETCAGLGGVGSLWVD